MVGETAVGVGPYYPNELIDDRSNDGCERVAVAPSRQYWRDRTVSETDLPVALSAVDSDKAEMAYRQAVLEDLSDAPARSGALALLAEEFDVVATVGELNEAMDPDRGDVKHNDVVDTIDRLGPALRIPDIEDPTNEPTILGLYGERDEHASLLETVAAADRLIDIKLPDDERVRRIVRYAGAELLVDADIPDSGAGDDPDRSDSEGTDGESATESEPPAAEDEPSPDDGVLGYDPVRTDRAPRTGRPLRCLVYALLTEPGAPLAASEAQVDRVDLLNYGEPTVDEEALPREFVRPRLESDGLRSENYVETAIDLQVLGEFPQSVRERSAVETHLRRLTNAVHYLSRYETSMREGSIGADDGANRTGSDSEVVRDGGHRLGTELDHYPAGLRDAVDRLLKDWKNDYWGTECRVHAGEVNCSSRSTMDTNQR